MKISKLPIVPLALILGVLGLFSDFTYYFFATDPGETNIFQQILYWISPNAGFWMQGLDILNISNDSGMGSINIISVLVFTLFLIGALLYYYSDGKRSNLLRVCFSIILLTAGLGMIFGPLNFIFIQLSDDLNISYALGNNWSWIPFFAKNVILTFISFKIIKQITKENESKIISANANQPVNRGYRFAHYLIDMMVCFFYLALAIKNSIFFARVLDFGYEFDELSLQIAFYLSLILYYIFFEATFQATPGKMATGSKLVAEKGKLSIGKVIGRTFSRFVPFEPFSFFGDKGWHDKWTNTTVVKEGSQASEKHKITYEELGLIDA
ncbi:RDD family protein [Mangrovivirga cuniculi]|uniref:RDD domain-containing protein n=1 Tax=Mangrovivirga cuniculi TaxID=2715131 RepID=A0A4D7K7C1_9BACT|nr:RDD family protein [Mangrovivirga cuniculi]QCK16604.1 hypothetical protein DCC35_18650 [Mangrovivirga cuniculi]